MRNQSKQMALGGIFAALAVIIMNLGGLIPVATYVCPVLCMVLLRFVDAFCGKRVAWAWYAVVSILSLLLSPDKEAAAVFLFLGYYPIIKGKLDQTRAKWLWKLLFFNGASVTLYWILLNVIGMAELVQEMDEMGTALLWVLLAMGNVTFFMVDRLLNILESRLLRRAR